MPMIDLLITDEIREAANLEAANSILERNGITVTRLDWDPHLQQWITDTNPRLGSDPLSDPQRMA
jgi:hypothetical protein